MTNGDTDYVEASAHLGLALILMGVGLQAVHAVFAVFTGWAWAVLFGSMWVAIGALLLFPDVRLYQYDQSPLEQVLLDADESDAV